MEQGARTRGEERAEIAPMERGGEGSPTTIFTSRVPRSRFMADTAVMMVLGVAVIVFTIGVGVDIMERTGLERRTGYFFCLCAGGGDRNDIHNGFVSVVLVWARDDNDNRGGADSREPAHDNREETQDSA